MTVLIATLQTALTSDKAVDKKEALKAAKADGFEICALNKSKATMDGCIQSIIDRLTPEVSTPVAAPEEVTPTPVAELPIEIAAPPEASTQGAITQRADVHENQAAPMMLMIAVVMILLDQVRLLFLFFIPTPLESLKAMGSRIKTDLHEALLEFNPLVDFIGSALSP